MNSLVSFVTGLLTSVLSFLGFVQPQSTLPQVPREQEQQVAQPSVKALTNDPSQTPERTGATFVASASTGSVPLTVLFTSNKYSTHDASEPQYYVDFGDGTARERITCTESAGEDMGSYHCVRWGVEHTYTSAGAYSAKLIVIPGCVTVASCPDQAEEVLQTVTISVLK